MAAAEKTTDTPIGDEVAAEKSAPAGPFAPTVGQLVTNAAGQLGIVTGPGREPAEGEGPEPLVAWLATTPAAYGGELSPLA